MRFELQDDRIRHGSVIGDGLAQADCKRAANSILNWLHKVPDIDFPDVSIVELGLVRGIHLKGGGETLVYLTLTTPECKHAETIITLCTRGLSEALKEIGSSAIANAAIEPFLPAHRSKSGEDYEATDAFREKLGNTALHPAADAIKWTPTDATPGARARIKLHLLAKTSPPITVGGIPINNDSARALVAASFANSSTSGGR